MDNNIFYDKNDIEVIVEDDEFGSITGFINSLKDKVASISYTNTPPTSYSSYTGYYGESKVKSFDNFTNQSNYKSDKKTKEKEAPEGKAWYWCDGFGHEGWD